MMKSTLIKDLYGEIERLKAGKKRQSLTVVLKLYYSLSSALTFFLFANFKEVYASREKNGVYMPKERYYQEESERKVLSF